MKNTVTEEVGGAVETAATRGVTPTPSNEENKPLSVVEKKELAACEAVIETGLKTFLSVGNALLLIRESRLYRGTHATFSLYCRERWAMSKTHANRFIGSAVVAKNLAPIGVTPTSESQVRALTGLPADAQKKVWKQAERAAAKTESPVTAKLILNAARTLGIRVTPQAATTRAGGTARGDNLVKRDQVMEAISEWAAAHWEAASHKSVAQFLREIRDVVENI